MSRVWAVCSGCGGVGKTTIAASLAVAAAKAGKRVILLDTSAQMRSCDLILGLEHAMTLDLVDVLSQQVNLEAALYSVPRYENLQVSCSTLHESASLTEFSGVILALQTLCDVLVLDLPTGELALGEGILHRDDLRIFVTRSDDISIRATEGLIRQIWNEEGQTHVIVNRFRRDFVRRGAHHTQDAVGQMLDCAIDGSIPEDDSIPLGAMHGRAAIECDGPAWECLKKIAASFIETL